MNEKDEQDKANYGEANLSIEHTSAQNTQVVTGYLYNVKVVKMECSR